ncbi:MAG TPA: hypothetical protein VMU14_11385 [Acidimicrobiales bacterium]|nr:hypothetical protein [Acidimicrobiales bacterium]
MVPIEQQQALTRFYAALDGVTEDFVRAFDRARGEFMGAGLEWVEPFGVFTGVERVVQEMIVPHTQFAERLHFTAEHVFPTRGREVCAAGRSGGRLRNGVEFEGRFVHIWEFDGDRAVRMTAYNEEGVMEAAAAERGPMGDGDAHAQA